jgi:fructose transport system permease protein
MAVPDSFSRPGLPTPHAPHTEGPRSEQMADTEPDAAVSALVTRVRNVFTLPRLGPLAALLITGLFFSFTSDRFLTSGNLSLVMQQVTEVGTLAIGEAIIILTAGIDLSNGAVMAFGGIVMTKTAVNAGLPSLIAILAGIAACAAFGALNGTLVATIKLPPFIVTLGTLGIATALTHIYSNEQTITGLPHALTVLGDTFQIGSTRVAYSSIVMLTLFAAAWYVLRHTSTGRHIYAVGDNLDAVCLSGINTRRLLIGVYSVAGVLYGIAALLVVARTGVGDPQAGQTDNLTSITAVVLGGISLFGGRGGIVGALLGALLVGVLRNGLQLMEVDSIYQILITGILVLLAVTVDQLTRMRQT